MAVGVFIQLFNGPWGLLRGGPDCYIYGDRYTAAAPFEIIVGPDGRKYANIMGLCAPVTPALYKASERELHALGLTPKWERYNKKGHRDIIGPSP